jgi:hypothetical protein
MPSSFWIMVPIEEFTIGTRAPVQVLREGWCKAPPSNADSEMAAGELC